MRATVDLDDPLDVGALFCDGSPRTVLRNGQWMPRISGSVNDGLSEIEPRSIELACLWSVSFHDHQ